MIQTGAGMLGLMLFAGAAWGECAPGDASRAAVSQFVVRSGEVYDRQTNLTWQRCSVGQRWLESGGCAGTPSKFKFDDAQALAAGAWRVPNVEELTSIVATYCKEPAVDDEIFPGTPAEYYWTSIFTSPMAWYVAFRNGSANFTYYSDSAYAVRLVRSGQ
jgi:hypothetical protein